MGWQGSLRKYDKLTNKNVLHKEVCLQSFNSYGTDSRKTVKWPLCVAGSWPWEEGTPWPADPPHNCSWTSNSLPQFSFVSQLVIMNAHLFDARMWERLRTSSSRASMLCTSLILFLSSLSFSPFRRLFRDPLMPSLGLMGLNLPTTSLTLQLEIDRCQIMIVKYSI